MRTVRDAQSIKPGSPLEKITALIDSTAARAADEFHSSAPIGAILLALAIGLLPVDSALAQEPDSVATNAVPSVSLPPALDRVLRDYEHA
jgi:hypothetical protein